MLCKYSDHDYASIFEGAAVPIDEWLGCATRNLLPSGNRNAHQAEDANRNRTSGGVVAGEQKHQSRYGDQDDANN